MKKCFVISPIGDEGSEIRKRADQILKHIITPAANACGFEPIRADQISEPGLITSQVIQHIVDDPIVIADLTDRNPNVFYELAIRHSIRKPLVQIIQKGESIPFDVAGMRTISVDHRDLDSVEEAKQEIQKQIKAVMDKNPEEIESPISVSLELQTLRKSEKPEERSYAELISIVSLLGKQTADIERRLSSPAKLLPPEYFREMLERPLIRDTGAREQVLSLLRYIRHAAREIRDYLKGKVREISKKECEALSVNIIDRTDAIYRIIG